METQILFVIGATLILLFFLGIKVVRPAQRGLIERRGEYRKFAKPGFHWIIPFIDEIHKVNTTEQMVDAPPQDIITNDNLNVSVYSQVYFKVVEAEEGVKSSRYNVNDYSLQIVNLARTTLRNIIGKLTLTSANSEPGKISAEFYTTMKRETSSWGIAIVRTELILI